MATHGGELGLQEQLVALHEAGGKGPRDRGANACLVVVTALVRRVDAAEAGLEGQPRQALGVRFLPGRAVDEAGHANTRYGTVARNSVRMLQGKPLTVSIGLSTSSHPTVALSLQACPARCGGPRQDPHHLPFRIYSPRLQVGLARRRPTPEVMA